MLEVFKEVLIKGNPNQFRMLIAELTKKPPTKWRRDSAREPRVTGSLERGHELAVFRFSGKVGLPSSLLFLVGRGDALRVTNIVPNKKGISQLTRAQYNAIADDFAGHLSRLAN